MAYPGGFRAPGGFRVGSEGPREEKQMTSDNRIPDFMESVATPAPARASAAEVATQRVLDLDTAMMGIYEDALATFEANIRANCPIILALFTNEGGEFTLYRPGEEPIFAPPVPVGYQVVKSTGHSSMAVYQLAAPHLGDPDSTAWHAPMSTYCHQQQLALDVVDDLDVPDEPREAVRSLLSANVEYMRSCLDSGSFDIEGLEAYARSQKPHIQAAIKFAADTQVSHWMGVLDEWKELLGDAWERTYGVTNSLYVTRTNNIMFTAMAQYFGKQAFNDRLLLFETTEFQTDRETMLNLLSRIIADRALGKVFFKDYFLMDVELLSTGARDAVKSEVARRVPASSGAYTAPAGHGRIKDEAERRGMEPLMPPLAPFHSQQWPWRTEEAEGEGAKTLAEIE